MSRSNRGKREPKAAKSRLGYYLHRLFDAAEDPDRAVLTAFMILIGVLLPLMLLATIVGGFATHVPTGHSALALAIRGVLPYFFSALAVILGLFIKIRTIRRKRPKGKRSKDKTRKSKNKARKSKKKKAKHPEGPVQAGQMLQLESGKDDGRAASGYTLAKLMGNGSPTTTPPDANEAVRRVPRGDA